MMRIFYTAEEVQNILGVSRAQAYSIIRELNEQLRKKGYIILAGKIPKKYLHECCYGSDLLEI